MCASDQALWFFLRYRDPELHLRVRVHGPHEFLWRRLWPALNDALRPFRTEGGIWRIQLDTYEREIERYGGEAAFPAIERLFAADSDAVSAILAENPADDMRWRIALIGMDRLLDDFGFTIEDKLRLTRKSGKSAPSDVRAEPLNAQLKSKYRSERARLEALMWPSGTLLPDWTPIMSILDNRSRAARTAFGELRRIDSASQLFASLDSIASSLLHLHANRMFTGAWAEQEWVLYKFLERLYVSRCARSEVG